MKDSGRSRGMGSESAELWVTVECLPNCRPWQHTATVASSPLLRVGPLSVMSDIVLNVKIVQWLGRDVPSPGGGGGRGVARGQFRRG